MPDDDPTPEPGTPEPTSTPEPEPTSKPDDGPTQLPDDHPLVKAYNATKAELADAKGKVKEFEDLSKSEQEKLTERASELEKNLGAAEANAARYEIALEKGLTKSQAKRLVGSTREELEADAAELLEDLGLGDDPQSQPARRPKERLKSGAAPDTEPEPDAEKLADRILSSGF